MCRPAYFRDLNLALFGVSRLRLEIEAAGGNGDAVKMLSLRADIQFHIGNNSLGKRRYQRALTLLSEIGLSGRGAFVFSTVAITFLAQIIPQAYFREMRYELLPGLHPFLSFYQVMLFAVAKPTALFLNWWLGQESTRVAS